MISDLLGWLLFFKSGPDSIQSFSQGRYRLLPFRMAFSLVLLARISQEHCWCNWCSHPLSSVSMDRCSGTPTAVLAVLSLKGATRRPLLERQEMQGKLCGFSCLHVTQSFCVKSFSRLLISLSFETGFQLCRSGWPRTQGTGLEVCLYNRFVVGSRA